MRVLLPRKLQSTDPTFFYAILPFPSPLRSAPSQSGVPPPFRLLPPPKLHRSEAVLVYNSSNMMYYYVKYGLYFLLSRVYPHLLQEVFTHYSTTQPQPLY